MARLGKYTRLKEVDLDKLGPMIQAAVARCIATCPRAVCRWDWRLTAVPGRQLVVTCPSCEHRVSVVPRERE